LHFFFSAHAPYRFLLRFCPRMLSPADPHLVLPFPLWSLDVCAFFPLLPFFEFGTTLPFLSDCMNLTRVGFFTFISNEMRSPSPPIPLLSITDIKKNLYPAPLPRHPSRCCVLFFLIISFSFFFFFFESFPDFFPFFPRFTAEVVQRSPFRLDLRR